MGPNIIPGILNDAIALPLWLASMDPKKLYAYRIHPGSEAKIMRAFKMHGIDGYLPMMPKYQSITQRSRWNNSERKVQRRVIVPVFPGLVFVPEREICWGSGLRNVAEGVIDLLQFGPWTAYLDDEWCNNLLTIVQLANVPRSKRALLFKAGDEVRVSDGPFRGFTGRFEGLDSKGRLSVLMSMFGRLQPVQVTEEQIEPV
jgi:transcription antitermination factor NusG